MDSTLQSSIAFAERVAIIGFAMVIIGVVGEGCELALRWAKRRKRLREIFDGEYRRIILSVAWRTRHLELEYETAFFMLLVLGLGIELVGSFSATRLQGKYNAILHDRATQAELKIEELKSKNHDAALVILRMQKEIWLRSMKFRDSTSAFVKSLEGKPTCEVTVLYAPENSEAEEFGYVLTGALAEARWPVHVTMPIPTNMVDVNIRGKPESWLRIMTSQRRATATFEPLTMLTTSGWVDGSSTPAGALATALNGVQFGPRWQGDPLIPSNTVVLIIGWDVHPAEKSINLDK